MINLFFGVAGVLSGFHSLLKGKSSMLIFSIILIGSFLGFTNAWFFFVMCNRGLHVEDFKYSMKY